MYAGGLERYVASGGLNVGYLSGVNFQALRSFCACSSFSLYCLSCFFMEENMTLTAGSTITRCS